MFPASGLDIGDENKTKLKISRALVQYFTYKKKELLPFKWLDLEKLSDAPGLLKKEGKGKEVIFKELRPHTGGIKENG